MKTQFSPENIIVAIDVGTTKICVLVAQQTGNGQLTIIGIGKAPSAGLARGIVVDIAPAVQSIKTALKEAELMAGCTIESAYIGISGSHIQSLNSHGMVPIKHGEVRETDIENVITAAKAIPIPEGQQILHVLPQFYTIDAGHRIQDPTGMHGVRLEAQVHIITGGVSSVQNLVRCCEMAGIKVRDIILEPLASADAVLSEDECTLGVAMLDIGGGTSDFALYQHGSIRHTKIFPIAGNLFTNDIAICLRTTLKEAEHIKKQYGISHSSLLAQDDVLEIDMVHGEQKQLITLSQLVNVIEPRAQELLNLIHQEITTYHLATFAHTGLVLTGGGSLLLGMPELAQQMLGLPVRIGKPKISYMFKEALDSPIYATGYGLLVHALKKNKSGSLDNLSGAGINRIFWRMKSWVMDFF